MRLATLRMTALSSTTKQCFMLAALGSSQSGRLELDFAFARFGGYGHAGGGWDASGIIRLNRMGIDGYPLGPRQEVAGLVGNPGRIPHRLYGKAGLGRRAADLDVDRAPARKRHDTEGDEIEQKLHSV